LHIERKALAELEKIRKYPLALRLRKEGLSTYSIAKELDINVYHIKNWIYFKRKPRLYRFI